LFALVASFLFLIRFLLYTLVFSNLFIIHLKNLSYSLSISLLFLYLHHCPYQCRTAISLFSAPLLKSSFLVPISLLLLLLFFSSYLLSAFSVFLYIIS
jgi:hypothetical protein